MSWHRCYDPEHEKLEVENERLRAALSDLFTLLADTGTGLGINHPAKKLLREHD